MGRWVTFSMTQEMYFLLSKYIIPLRQLLDIWNHSPSIRLTPSLHAFFLGFEIPKQALYSKLPPTPTSDFPEIYTVLPLPGKL